MICLDARDLRGKRGLVFTTTAVLIMLGRMLLTEMVCHMYYTAVAVPDYAT